MEIFSGLASKNSVILNGRALWACTCSGSSRLNTNVRADSEFSIYRHEKNFFFCLSRTAFGTAPETEGRGQCDAEGRKLHTRCIVVVSSPDSAGTGRSTMATSITENADKHPNVTPLEQYYRLQQKLPMYQPCDAANCQEPVGSISDAARSYADLSCLLRAGPKGEPDESYGYYSVHFLRRPHRIHDCLWWLFEGTRRKSGVPGSLMKPVPG